MQTMTLFPSKNTSEIVTKQTCKCGSLLTKSKIIKDCFHCENCGKVYEYNTKGVLI